MWLPMYVKGSEGYLSQLDGDRLGRAAGGAHVAYVSDVWTDIEDVDT